MDKNTLIDILESKSMLTKKEIQIILDEELEKSPEEIDADLVMACLDVLESSEEEQKEKAPEKKSKKSKRIDLTKVLLIAAVIVLAIAVALPVSAKFLHFKASDKVVQYYSDHFKIDLRGAEEETTEQINGAQLISFLEKKGVENVILPKALLQEEYKVEYINDKTKDRNNIEVYLKNELKSISVDVFINGYDGQYDFSVGKDNTDKNYNLVEEINAGKLIVVIFNNKDKSLVRYVDSQYDYSITLSNCSFDQAKDIAKTIEE